MNRIYELAKEAGMIEFDSIPGSNAVTPDHTSVVKAQKFAELIVRKAMDYASRNWEHGHLLAEDLKVYFGVEK